ncbi:hypothetical protein D3C77_709100 [compost metagenome]
MRVEHRAGRAREAGVTTAKMFVLMDGQGLALNQARANTVGTFASLAPVSAKP